MIKVEARILQRSVFIVGENIECEITVTNNGQTDNNKIEKNRNRHASALRVYPPEVHSRNDNLENKTMKDASVTLAWASAQIYCHCSINERQVKLPVNLQNHIKQNHITKYTSFSPVMGERGDCLCSTSATVLFCDLKLVKGESKTFLYSQKLPIDLPPSYKGHNIKLSYKVCIGIGRIGEPLYMIRLPFKLYQVKGVLKSILETPNKNSGKQNESSAIPLDGKEVSEPNKNSEKQDETPFASLDGKEVSKANNPFLKDNMQDKYSILDAAMESLTMFTVKRNMNTYNIQSVNGTIGKFCLSKYYYRLGEDVLGTFDFSDGPISCIKYSVSLQIEETISKKCLLQPSLSNLVHYITLSCHEECCCLASRTNFLLSIPVTATSEFTHKIVSIRWRLHFEFIIDSTENEGKELEVEDGKKVENKIPSKLKTESMLWDLPIHVVATNPIQASLMMQAESSETINLKISNTRN